MQLSVTTGGSGPLVKATVLSFPRENLAVRATAIRVQDAAGKARIYTGPRLRSRHLIALENSSRHLYSAAVQDDNGNWSGWSPAQSLTVANFIEASTSNVSIGSGVTEDLMLEEPAVRFPQLNVGSSRQEMFRTVVSEGFYDETRRAVWKRSRSVFHCVLADLEEAETLLLHRFYRALNGPLTPFWFNWLDPDTGKESSHIVRFRDPSLADQMFTLDCSSMEFTLIEVLSSSEGGSV